MDKLLGEIQQTLIPYLPKETAAAMGSTQSAPQAGTGASRQAQAPFTGEIQSRSDVIRVLDQICDYYRSAEPGSPVPLLIRRAQRLVDKDFMSLMEDLVPESLGPLASITGQRRDAGSSASPPSGEISGE
jgi:type VI secretion system protein ImpA